MIPARSSGEPAFHLQDQSISCCRYPCESPRPPRARRCRRVRRVGESRRSAGRSARSSAEHRITLCCRNIVRNARRSLKAPNSPLVDCSLSAVVPTPPVKGNGDLLQLGGLRHFQGTSPSGGHSARASVGRRAPRLDLASRCWYGFQNDVAGQRDSLDADVQSRR